MPLLRFDKTSFVDICFHCGQRNTHFIDVGATKGKDGPYHLLPDMTLTVRVDDEEGGPGHVEEAVFAHGDFPAFDVISCDQLVAKLARSFKHVTAVNDYGGILLLSKAPSGNKGIHHQGDGQIV